MKNLRLTGIMAASLLAASTGLSWGADFINEGIAYSLYEGEDEIAYVTFPDDDQADMVDYTGIINIPASFIQDGKEIKVEGIGQYAFRDCMMLTDVILPESIVEIGEGSFYNCTRLSSISLPESLKSIGDFSFYNCKLLESVVIPENITELPRYSFTLCDNLKEVRIDGKIERIEEYAFFKDNSLTSISFPEGLTSIGEQAFADCQKLENISFPKSLKKIENAAFSNNFSIKNLDFSGLDFIDMNVFAGCKGLEEIDLSKFSGQFIGSGAFKGCSGARKVLLPEIETLPSFLFSDCSGFESLELPEDLNSIGSYCFSGCYSIKEISIGSSVTNIDSYAFSGCSGVSAMEGLDHEMIIGEGAFQGMTGIKKLKICNVKDIPQSAFAHCRSLEELEINLGVERIEGWAFSDCPNLMTIYVEGLLPPVISINTFDIPTEQTAIVKVEPEAVAIFQQSAQWNRFLHIEGSSDLPWAGIETAVPAFITISGGEVFANGVGEIMVFDIQGRLCGIIGSGIDSMSLPKGIYILKSSGKTSKIKI
ncbi:MAG: leucine-rich repeat protein [Muribaculaceae bacterium]|nr:leucine-rich repeat protein [Muribaculaceae bacterium]